MTKKELIVGLDFSAPIPMHTDFSSQTFEGFEVDLMQLVSKKLGLQLKYESSLWKDILYKLQLGDIDLICSAVTITPDRQRILDFSIPYLSFRLCAVTNSSDTITTMDGLKAKTIGVRRATEAEKFVMEFLPNSKIFISDTNNELYGALTAKEIDAVIDDSPIAGAFARSNPHLAVSLFLPGTESEYAIAIKKDNTQLKDSINAVLKEIKTTDYWKTLYDKWFNEILL
jgi:ABC-type amino acid transport substrate-binding protein